MRQLLLFLSILSIVLTAGCATTNETSPSPENNPQVRVQQSMPENSGYDQSGELVEHLENLAANVPGVQSAHCVLLGNTAVVGINVDADMERSRVGTIKYSVAEALRKDPDGANAIVTADLDMTERLREMGDDIRGGRPVAGFVEELADIIGRIIPQLPMDVVPQDDIQEDRNETNSGINPNGAASPDNR
ncbi:YhcN/YlaJ family sporulation lipoprotein [Paenibacillus daejeonensis]|uniref:YhcN/YlaJ family sporulation lipoprotein n=1 Tax=Paenibacillus daejeonensis TaxID=135193 RepID=UPI00037E09C4|nr:YhcN/YlaJ family sporulation lipoprotein [Paenibacillus daejeonensis]